MSAKPAGRSPDELLAELKSAMDFMPPKSRDALAAKLRELAPPPPAVSVSPLTLKMLGLAENAPIDPRTVAPLLSALIEFAVKMDDTTWATWKGFGSESKSFKREVQLKALFKAMLKGNAKLTPRQVEFQIASLMRLTARVMAEFPKVGTYATNYLRPGDPSNAQLAAGMQRAVNKEIAKTVGINVKIENLPV